MAKRRKEHRYQLPLELARYQDPEPEGIYQLTPGIFAEFLRQQAEGERFVRQLKESAPIRSPADAAQHLMTNIYVPFESFDQEELWVLLLNTKNRITHDVMVYRGTINTIYIRPAELLKEAVRQNAASMILSHCHPSGDPTPSPEDVQMTRIAREAAKLLGIEVLDHLVVGDGVWVSLKERGLGFE